MQRCLLTHEIMCRWDHLPDLNLDLLCILSSVSEYYIRGPGQKSRHATRVTHTRDHVQVRGALYSFTFYFWGRCAWGHYGLLRLLLVFCDVKTHNLWAQRLDYFADGLIHWRCLNVTSWLAACLTADWLLTGCDCWLAAGWLSTGCRLAANWLSTGCCLAADWLWLLNDHRLALITDCLPAWLLTACLPAWLLTVCLPDYLRGWLAGRLVDWLANLLIICLVNRVIAWQALIS